MKIVAMVARYLLGLMFVGPLVLVAVQAGKEVRGVYETIDKALRAAAARGQRPGQRR